MLFLPVFNFLDGMEDARQELMQQRRQDGHVWQLVRGVPRLEPLLDEWLDKGANREDKGTLGNLIERPRRVTRWWAQTTGQEQGWGLFAPDTVSFSAFPSVELRWGSPDAE